MDLDHADAQRVRGKLPGAVVPPATVIRTLGQFEVLHDGAPVAWPSLKVREIVKILLSRRGQPVARATLKALRWPDEEHERLGNRLSVALSAARSVLDAGRQHPPHHGIIASDDAVRIDLANVKIDVEQFLTDAERGLALLRQHDPRAADLLTRAHARYTGEFLETDVDKEFASALRGHAGVRYVQVAHALAEIAVAQDDHHTAACHLLPVLARDPYDERTHLALVRILEQAGDRGEARRRYRQYVTRMAELEVNPAPFPALQRAPAAKQPGSRLSDRVGSALQRSVTNAQRPRQA